MLGNLTVLQSLFNFCDVSNVKSILNGFEELSVYISVFNVNSSIDTLMSLISE